MTSSRRPGRFLQRLGENIPLRIAIYYAALIALVIVVLPGVAQRVPLLGGLLTSALGHPIARPHRGAAAAAGGAAITNPFTAVLGAASAADPAAAVEVPALAVGAAALAAFLLALPVAWVYMLTREKKGYRQTVVHTLVLLPMVVAGVAVLVKDSVALALSVAGIAAAVRFRSTLDDSKDAVYLLVALVLGLGAGADLGVGLALSVVFNLAALAIFYTDFGRTPPALEGERAKRQLERATAIANRTSEFVAQVDDAVLRELAPAQLDALAQRLRRRRDDAATNLPPPPALEYDARLRIVTSDPHALRVLVEPVLESRVKRWRLDPEGTTGEDEVVSDDEPAVIAYRVRWRKGTPPDAVLAEVREQGAPFVVSAEIL